MTDLCRFHSLSHEYLQTLAKSLGNSDDRADQKTERNGDNTFGIPRENLELKPMFILYS